MPSFLHYLYCSGSEGSGISLTSVFFFLRNSTSVLFALNWAQNQKPQLARNREISCVCGRKLFGKRTVTARTVALQRYRLEENILIIIVTDIDGTPESAAPHNDTN